MVLNDKQSKEFLKSVEGKYDYKKYGGGYINVVGTKYGLFEFITYANDNNIWINRVYTFCTYYGTQFKGIFCKEKDIDKISKFVKKQDNLVLNASNPF